MTAAYACDRFAILDRQLSAIRRSASGPGTPLKADRREFKFSMFRDLRRCIVTNVTPEPRRTTHQLVAIFERLYHIAIVPL